MKFIICGPGASGKDYLKNRLEEKGFRRSVSYTTRPPRNNETDGVDYHFTDKSTFLQMIERNEFREWNKFAEKWYYGTTQKNFDDSNLFIMTPSGIHALTPEERAGCFIIYLDIDESVRLERLNNRNSIDDPERRISTDREDFNNFKDYDLKITNPDF